MRGDLSGAGTVPWGMGRQRFWCCLLNIHEKDASFPKSKYALFGNHFLKTVASNKILVKGKLYVFSAAAPSAGG
ncbi:MAG: hypothetical protein KHW93_05745 [Butyricicoccus pullicaecorum]|nr:hypothetical protein [Butyricicoccus pullicaecorum]